MGVYLLYCAMYDFAFGQDHSFIYLFLQAGAFFDRAGIRVHRNICAQLNTALQLKER